MDDEAQAFFHTSSASGELKKEWETNSSVSTQAARGSAIPFNPEMRFPDDGANEHREDCSSIRNSGSLFQRLINDYKKTIQAVRAQIPVLKARIKRLNCILRALISGGSAWTIPSPFVFEHKSIDFHQPWPDLNMANIEKSDEFEIPKELLEVMEEVGKIGSTYLALIQKQTSLMRTIQQQRAQQQRAQQQRAQQQRAQQQRAQQQRAQQQRAQQQRAQPPLVQVQQAQAQAQLVQVQQAQPRVAQRQLEQRQLEQRQLAQRQLAQRQLAQRQLAQRQLAQRQLAQRQLAQRQPVEQKKIVRHTEKRRRPRKKKSEQRQKSAIEAAVDRYRYALLSAVNQILKYDDDGRKAYDYIPQITKNALNNLVSWLENDPCPGDKDYVNTLNTLLEKIINCHYGLDSNDITTLRTIQTRYKSEEVIDLTGQTGGRKKLRSS